MSEIDALREKVQQARAAVVVAQHALITVERELYRAKYQRYLERLQRFTDEVKGPVDSVVWFQRVRPLCEDCQEEISDPNRPRSHSLTMRMGDHPIVCCGHSRWGGTGAHW